MKHILFDLFLVSLGSGIGVVTMCLVRAGSQFDRDMETWKEVRNNEFRTELIQLVFIQCTVTCAYGNRCYRGVSRFQA